MKRRGGHSRVVRELSLARVVQGLEFAHTLVDNLNVLARRGTVSREHTSVERRESEAWREMESILEASLREQPRQLSDDGIRLFNKRAAECPGVLCLSDQDSFVEDDNGKRIAIQGVPGINFKDAGAYASYVLWRVLEARLLGRVKRCLECKRWFVDETRNKSAERCSRACTVKWWNRPHRRDARHAQYRDPARKRRQKGRTGQ